MRNGGFDTSVDGTLSSKKNNTRGQGEAQRTLLSRTEAGSRAHAQGARARACGQACGPPRERRQAPRSPEKGVRAPQTALAAGRPVRARGHGLSVRTPTCRVDTSTGPLSCPTRKNSTVTVLSVRRDAPARWVNRGKARARAQAEAKASGRSHTICSTERQSCEEQGRGPGHAGPRDAGPRDAGPTREPPAGSAGAHGWVGRRCAYNLDTGAPAEPSPQEGSSPQATASTCEKEDTGHQLLPTAFHDGTWRDEQQPPCEAQSGRPPRPTWEEWLRLSDLGVPVPGSGYGVGAVAASEAECSAVTLRSPGGRGPPPLGTHHNAPMSPRRQAGPRQSGDEVCGRGAVVPAHARGQGGHGGAVQVQRAAVRGVGVECA